MQNQPKTCAIWARVSTDEQDSSNQVAELRAWAQRRGLEVTAEYILDGVSGWKGANRAKLTEALAVARLGKFDVMLCWALDRISREGIEATLSIMRQFHQQGCPIWSLREPWTETSDPHMRDLITAIMAWVAQMESQRRSERTKAGIERKKRENPDWKPGRQQGARDKVQRNHSGYYAREEAKRAERARATSPASARSRAS